MNPSQPNQAPPGRASGFVFAFGSAVGTAVAVIPYKLATTEAPASEVVVLMLLSAATFNSLAALARVSLNAGQPSRVEATGKWTTTLWVSLLAGALAAGANYTGTQAVARLEPPVAVLLVQTQVVTAALLGWVWLREAVTQRFVIGTFVAIAGIAMLRVGSNLGEIEAAGVLYGLAGAACFGAMHVAIRRYVDEIDLIATNALRLWIAVAFVSAIPGAASNVLNADARIIMLAAAAAFCGPFLGRLLMMHAARSLPAASSTLVGLASPALAVGTSWVFLEMLPSGREILAGGVVMLGLLLALAPAKLRMPRTT